MDEYLRVSQTSMASAIMISDVQPVAQEEEIYSVEVFRANGDDTTVTLKFTEPKLIDTGTFGSVSLITLLHNNEDAAIKTVFLERKVGNRELEIMKTVRHCNIIELKYYFFEKDKDKIKMNLILEYLPQNLYKILKHYQRFKMKLHPTYIKVFMYQLLKVLNYLQALGICHRDIKPQNLLLNYATGELKLCDFGSAKKLVEGEKNVSYICSRYYRAPELLFGSDYYTTKVDVWSAGCIFAELLFGRVFFSANSTLEMLVEIINVLGTPTQSQIRKMNPKAPKFDLPVVRPRKMSLFLKSAVPADAGDLLSKILAWEPDMRIAPIYACCHPFFDELRNSTKKLPDGKAVPFVELTVAHASVLTILAISFERYYAICQPLRAGYVCTKARALLICLLAWIFAALFTSPVLMVSEFREEEYYDGRNVTTCLMEANEFWTSFYFTMSTTVFFCLPLAILVGLYSVIARNLLSNHGLVAPNNQSAALRYRRQVVMMLGTVVISFFICLLPFKAFTLYVIYAPPEILLSMGIETFYNILYICRMMFYINSAVNPILYNLMSSKFRDGFRKLLGISNHGNFARKGTVTTTTTLTSSAKTSSSDNLLRRSVVRVISLDEASRVDNGLSTTIKLLNNSIVRSDESYV